MATTVISNKPAVSTRELVKPFAHCTMGQMMPVLNAASQHFGLKLCRINQFRIAVRYTQQAAKNN